MTFNPCIPGQCTEDGTHCQGCGRSHIEIADTKKLVNGLVNFAQQQDYDNIEAFVDFVGSKVIKKIREG